MGLPHRAISNMGAGEELLPFQLRCQYQGE